jgi:hypothetical protein
MTICGKEVHAEGRLVRIARLAAERYEFLTDPIAAIEELRASGPRADLFTFVQSVAAAAVRYPHAMEWDNAAAVPVSTFETWWTKQINGKTRNMVRKAEKAGVEVRETPFDDDLVGGITAIYDECPVRQGRPFWHYHKGMDRVRRENATFLDRSVFLGAFAGGELIGFAKLVVDEARQQAALMQILAMIAHRDKAPMNALLAQAVRACADRGIPYLVYANFAYGNKQRDSLSDFKHHNGFQRVEVPRYFVPLTAVGRAALRLGLHRGLAARIPESVLARLRSVRSHWHAGELLSAWYPR